MTAHLRLAGVLLAATLSACGGGDDAPPGDTIYFGPISDQPVSFTLDGAVQYEDRLYGEIAPGRYGFTGASRFKPVRNALVDLVNESGEVLLSTRTDEQGRYAFTATAAGLLRLRVLARTEFPGGCRISVKTPDGDLYAVTRHFVPGDGNLTLDARIPLDYLAGVYNILDVYTAAVEFLRAGTGAYPPLPLDVFWSPGSRDGTYYSADGIHVLGGSGAGAGDTDEFDDDVLLHEFGHFVESFSGNADSAGGFHMLNDNTQDVRLAWSEGFASYMSGKIKRWLDESGSSVLSDTSETLRNPRLGPLYLDTFGSGERVHWFFDVDYATDPSRDVSSSFSTAETSIAKVLWNITHEFGFVRLWQAYCAYPPRLQRKRPVSIESFWDNWLSVNGDQNPLAAFRGRRIDYSADAFEQDDTIGRASAVTVDEEPTDTHTLHADLPADADFFKVRLHAGVPYVVETFGLLNGADTRLTIHAPPDLHHPLNHCGAGGAALCENDNWSLASYPAPGPDIDAGHRLMLNDGCKLASRLLFTPPASSTFLLRVTASRDPTPAAGRYGSYYLRISRNPAAYKCH